MTRAAALALAAIFACAAPQVPEAAPSPAWLPVGAKCERCDTLWMVGEPVPIPECPHCAAWEEA